MNLKYKCEPIGGPAKPAAAVFLPAGADALDRLEELSALRPLIQPHLASGAFKGGHLDVLPLLAAQDGWLVLVGLGPIESLGEARLLEAAAQAAKTLSRLRVKEAVAVLPRPVTSSVKTLELVATGLRLAAGARPTLKTDKPDPWPIKTITLLAPSAADYVDRAKNVLARAEAMAGAQLEARRLAEWPASLMTPEAFAAEAAALGKARMLKVTIQDERALAKAGAGAILAVGQGSVHPPRLVTVEYQGAAGLADAPAAVLVGKGVTFDSGGLCLKPAENMSRMKTDMSGAASVLAVMGAAAALRLPRRLVGLLPLAENMPSGSAYRPGDVVKTLSGQTVEIINTDAEGRLLLADALTLAARHNPSSVVDVATLTGACKVALGEKVAGLFCSDRTLRRAIMDAGQAVGEAFWPLPLHDDYDSNLSSDIADFKHTGSREGGAIHAALFLRRFAPPSVPWAHLDVCGTARASKDSPSCPEGASGFGVRTLIKLLSDA